jgi:hypothetical protein
VPALLARHPETDVAGCALNPALVPLFCFPEGAQVKFASTPPSPSFHIFVLTDEYGRHQYASARSPYALINLYWTSHDCACALDSRACIVLRRVRIPQATCDTAPYRSGLVSSGLPLSAPLGRGTLQCSKSYWYSKSTRSGHCARSKGLASASLATSANITCCLALCCNKLGWCASCRRVATRRFGFCLTVYQPLRATLSPPSACAGAGAGLRALEPIALCFLSHHAFISAFEELLWQAQPAL